LIEWQGVLDIFVHLGHHSSKEVASPLEFSVFSLISKLA
jgi:hypothetical protein